MESARARSLVSFLASFLESPSSAPDCSSSAAAASPASAWLIDDATPQVPENGNGRRSIGPRGVSPRPATALGDGGASALLVLRNDAVGCELTHPVVAPGRDSTCFGRKSRRRKVQRRDPRRFGRTAIVRKCQASPGSRLLRKSEPSPSSAMAPPKMAPISCFQPSPSPPPLTPRRIGKERNGRGRSDRRQGRPDRECGR